MLCRHHKSFELEGVLDFCGLARDKKWGVLTSPRLFLAGVPHPLQHEKLRHPIGLLPVVSGAREFLALDF